MKVNEVVSGFRIKGCEDLPDVNGRMWRFEYERNGAEVIWLERDDEVKTFVIAFKTIPGDDTGVAHVVEHSVLQGSRKYPVKSPFDELRRSSLQVYMNAFTRKDQTHYLFSSRNDTDYANLADVYLDAVFHPLLLTDSHAFRQEGWHYELKSAQDKLSINGVVYNEMKGVEAIPEHRAYHETLKALFPSNVYGKESGGKSSDIPNLSHADAIAFHARFYHPSNALVFLDGAVDVASILKKLDAVFGEYDRRADFPEIPPQPPVRMSLEIPFASETCERRTILTDGWALPRGASRLDEDLFPILANYLCGSNESPLSATLLRRKLCDDAGFWLYPYAQIGYALMIRNASLEQATTCRSVVRETLERLAAEGLDRKRLLALVDREEFRLRDGNGRNPRGIDYFNRAVAGWLYGLDPADAFRLTKRFAILRQGVTEGLFERKIREFFLENPHHVELALVPDRKIGEVRAQAAAERLATIRGNLSDADEARLVAETADLLAWQGKPNTPEALATLPVFRRSDIPLQGQQVEGDVVEKDGVTRIRSKSNSAGIAYLSLAFPIDGLNADELIAMPLLSDLVGNLPTARCDALTLESEIAGKIGRMGFSAVAEERGNYFKMSLAALSGKADEALELVREILLETRYDDASAIGKLSAQSRLTLEYQVASSGMSAAICRAECQFSRRRASNEILSGVSQLRWLQREVDGMRPDVFAELARKTFVRNGLVISSTDNLPEASVERLVSALPVSALDRDCRPIACSETAAGGFSIAGDTAFSAWAARLPDGETFRGSMLVAAKILSLGYLHHEVRELGGAYGLDMFVRDDGDVVCWTYRDPTPIASLEKIGGVGSALRRFVESGSDIDRYVVATIAELDPYRSAQEEAGRRFALWLQNRTPEDKKNLRREVLGTTREQLLAFADVLESISRQARTCVIGGSKHLSDYDAGLIEPILNGDK